MRLRMRMRILGVLASWIVHRVHSFLVTKIDHQGLCGIVVVVGHFLQTHTESATHRRRSSVQWHKSTSDHRLLWSEVDCDVLLLLGQHLSRLSVVITACQNANRNLLTFLSRIRLVGRTGLMLIDLDMRKIFSNACDVRRDASHTQTHKYSYTLLRKTQATNLRRRQRALFALQVATRHDTRWSQDRQVLIAIQFSVTSWRKANKAIKCLYT